MVKTEFMIIDVKSVAQRFTCVSLILLFIKEMSLVVAQEINPVMITPKALQIMLRTSLEINLQMTSIFLESVADGIADVFVFDSAITRFEQL